MELFNTLTTLAGNRAVVQVDVEPPPRKALLTMYRSSKAHQASTSRRYAVQFDTKSIAC